METIRVYYEDGSYYLLINDKKTLVEFTSEITPDGEPGYADINVLGGSLDSYTKDSIPEIKLIVEDWEYA